MNNPGQPQQLIDDAVRLAAIVESSDDAIVSKTLDGIITSWNKGAEKIFGYTEAEIIGLPMLTLLPDDRKGEEADILARLARGERVDHFETVRRHKSGQLVDVSVTISPVRNKDGVIVGASKIARNITQQKQIEQDLRNARDVAEAAREVAEQANRSKDLFLSVLSHELRTPLTPVLIALNLIESGPEYSDPELRDMIGMIRRNVETEARLVDDLLDVTRIIHGKVPLHNEILDVNKAVQTAVGTLQSSITAKQLRVASSLNAANSLTWADPGRFQQILVNLISNAVKFTPEGGTITLGTDNDPREPNRLHIVIGDNGIGIEPSALPRLFKPFEQGEQTISRRFGGLGLGLSIVRSLVEMHGGSVAVQSGGVGQGSTFTLSLKAVVAAQESMPVEPTVTRLKGAPSLRVLLVEDHEDSRRLLTRLLGSFGCEVKSAGTVKQAKESADTYPFDLLLSDIGLPDGTGLDVMRYVKHRPNLRAIAISGFCQEDDFKRSLDAGFEQHLTKPVNLQQLRDVIFQKKAG